MYQSREIERIFSARFFTDPLHLPRLLWLFCIFSNVRTTSICDRPAHLQHLNLMFHLTSGVHPVDLQSIRSPATCIQLSASAADLYQPTSASRQPLPVADLYQPESFDQVSDLQVVRFEASLPICRYCKLQSLPQILICRLQSLRFWFASCSLRFLFADFSLLFADPSAFFLVSVFVESRFAHLCLSCY